jgi:transcriptional regulator with XRE-family HTH domain
VPESPRRHLDPELAAAISVAKKRSGRTWRSLARLVGVSHSHLVNLARGRRVPSPRTTLAISAVLRLPQHITDGLLAAYRADHPSIGVEVELSEGMPESPLPTHGTQAD